jgi:hypothetical protein
MGVALPTESDHVITRQNLTYQDLSVPDECVGDNEISRIPHLAAVTINA